MKYTSLFNILFLSIFSLLSHAQGTDCNSVDPFCTGTNYVFPNVSNGSSTPNNGNNYDCLYSQPNPVWYYMEVDQGGSLVIDLEQNSGNGYGLDVDFIAYGPFGDLNDAMSNCGNLGNGSSSNTVVDCSYSASSTETVNINNAQPGEVFLVLITNYSGSSGTISFNQSGGNGTSNCGVLGCNIDNVSVNTSSCDLSTGDYTLNGSVEFIAAPDVGQLIIEDCNGNQATFSAPFTSPVNYSFIGLTADGSSCDVTAYFTDDNQCTLTESYTAPECDCSVDAGTDQEVCEDETITLTASNPDNGTITWNQGVSDGVAFTPAVGTQSYTVSMDLGGCSVTDDVEVIVHPKPTVTTRNDTLICENESITLSGGGADNYSWDNNVTDGVSFIPSQTNTYTVTGTITYECENSSQVTITVESLPEVSFQADSLTGCMPFTTTFTNTSTPSNATARWDFGDGAIGNSNTTITHTFDVPDCYTVNLEVETTNGCLSDLTIADYICVSGFPNASFGYTPTKPTTSESFVSFQNTSDNAITYEWDFGNGETSVVPNPALDFGNEPESYIIELVAENKAGCTDTVYDVIEIKEEIIYYVPNTFTPDGNEFNDTFKPVFTIGFDFKNYHLSIFNRWGELIFESHNSEIGWDGSYGNGRKEIVPEGTYVWKIKYKETGVDKHQEIVGHVNVLK